MPAYDLVTSVYDELGDDQEMIVPYQFGLLLIDWTNPQKAGEG
jgi:condensin complex subunit 3